MASKLTLDDIVDLRAYEREREEFRARIIELKSRRRVALRWAALGHERVRPRFIRRRPGR